MADANLIKKTDLARVREVDFVERFSENVRKLVEALSITRMIPKVAGTTLKTYKAVGTLESGIVGEGETIPLSKYQVQEITWKEITLKKWRKATSAEAIIERGYDQAVSMTTDRMLKDVQKGIRAEFFDFLGEGTGGATGADFQALLAQIWGKLQVLFEDDDVQAVYFVNQMDVADYLGDASISTQTAFGMTYIEDFLGLGTVILNSSVPRGMVYGTVADNIVLYYVAVNGADLNEAFSFTSDETGYIGIHEKPDYDNMTASDTVVNGMTLFAERLDGIVCGYVGTLTTVTAEAVGTGDGTTKKFTLDHVPYLKDNVKLTVKVGGTATTDYTLDGDEITFKTAPANNAAVTADYKYVAQSAG